MSPSIAGLGVSRWNWKPSNSNNKTLGCVHKDEEILFLNQLHNVIKAHHDGLLLGAVWEDEIKWGILTKSTKLQPESRVLVSTCVSTNQKQHGRLRVYVLKVSNR